MDQKISTTDLSKLAMTAMGLSMAGKNAKTAGAVEGQFQKLLEQRTKPVQKKAQKPAEDPKAAGKQDQDTTVDQPAEDGTTQQPEAVEGQQTDVEKTDASVEQAPMEDPLEQAKRLAELGAVFFQPDENTIWINANLETGEIYGAYGPKEYVVAMVDGQTENIPIVDLEPQQLEQLQQIIGDLKQMPSAEDPEADAMLEATDPTVEHGPAQLLEKVVQEQTGETVKQVTEEVLTPAKTQEEDNEDIQVELVDVDQGQAAKQVFQDVKAAPVKVGESFEPQLAQDVNEQITAQVIPAMEQGETRVKLQLTPEHLGTVKVEIVQSENGSLHIAITAQNSQTRNLLEKSADNLQSLLASRSQSTVRVEVQRQEENQPQHNNYDGHNSQQQQQQQEQHRPRSYQDSQDFLHQLRLGLVDEAWEEG